MTTKIVKAKKSTNTNATPLECEPTPDIWYLSHARQHALTEAIKLFVLPQFTMQANPANIVGLANTFTDFLLGTSKDTQKGDSSPQEVKFG